MEEKIVLLRNRGKINPKKQKNMLQEAVMKD